MKLTINWSTPRKFQEGNFGGLDFDGLYIISYRRPNTDKRFVIYVGQGCVDKRLSDNYWNNTCLSRKIRKNGGIGYYRFARCSDEDDRLDIELGLYNKYGEKDKLCNEQEPSGSGRYEDIVVEEKFK